MEEEDGDREIGSRGLTFLAGEAISLVVELEPPPSIAAVNCKLTPFLLEINHSHGEVCMDWLHTSFIFRQDSSFIGATIQTRWDLPELSLIEGSFTHKVVTSHLSITFPTRYSSPLRLRCTSPSPPDTALPYASDVSLY